MRAFIDTNGCYYKAEVAVKAATDLELPIINQDFLDALPEDGSSVAPALMNYLISNILRIRRGDLTPSERIAKDAFEKAAATDTTLPGKG